MANALEAALKYKPQCTIFSVKMAILRAIEGIYSTEIYAYVKHIIGRPRYVRLQLWGSIQYIKLVQFGNLILYTKRCL